MQTHLESIPEISPAIVEQELNASGFIHLPAVLSSSLCDHWAGLFSENELFRKTIDMGRYRFGEGCYKYFAYPLPAGLQTMRERLYELLFPIANRWNRILNRLVYPPTHQEFLQVCAASNQLRPTPLLLSYSEGGHNTLHQDLYGEIFFPLQAVFFLKQPNLDYSGGEFILVEQRPRAQSRAHVITPAKGDLIIFATSERPVHGTRGYYRVQMRHGVSTVRRGNRITLGIPFHDAL